MTSNTKLTKTVEKKIDILKTYKRYYGRTLSDVYSRCSNKKHESYEKIKNEMHDLGGNGLTVISFNSNMYTVAYTLGTNLVYHTKTRREIIPLELIKLA